MVKLRRMTTTICSVFALSALILGCGTAAPAQNTTNASTNTTNENNSQSTADSTTAQNGSESQGQSQAQTTAVKAPLFSLPTINGSQLSLQQLLTKKQPIVVNYFASWCPTCNSEMPDLTAVANQFSNKAQFLGVDAIGEDSVGATKDFMKKYQIHYPIVLDEGQQLATEYGLAGHPETVIIAPDGTVAWLYPGPITKAQLEQAITQVSAQTPSHS